MPSFRNRSYQPELLDRDDIPFEDIRRNMDELDVINTWLGGHGITISGLKKIINDHPEANTGLHLCEIGCGGGNNLRAVDRWLKPKGITAHFTGIDINPHCIVHAQSSSGLTNTTWITSDYRTVEFTDKPDIIFSSLFCHHFTDEQLVEMIQWMEANSKLGYFVNDLHRNPLAYHSIRLLTGIFSRSYLVKNDAPLSVLRGFSRKELVHLMQQAKQVNYSIRWRWAFRWLISSVKPK